jgi:hypothetical protein
MDSAVGAEPFLPQEPVEQEVLTMRLRAYLDTRGMKPTHFAVWLRVKPTRVWSWLRGTTPNKEMIEEIYRLTQGEIGPEDWFPICNGKLKRPGGAP